MKILSLILKIAAVLLALLVLTLAVILVPPHMQIRKVTPPIPQAEQLQALGSVSDGPVSIRYINTSTQALGTGHLGHTVFLIEWADGRVFMIDAGMDRLHAEEFAALLKKIGRGGDVDIHGVLPDLLGGATQRVMGAGFTHLHIDHAQGIVPFCVVRGPGATLYQTEFQRDLHNFNTKEAAALVAGSCLAAGSLSGEGVQTVDGFPGLGVIAAGGHTPGSTIYVVVVQGHFWVLAGDTTNSKADLLSNTGKGFVYSTFLVPENTGRLKKLRLWLSELDAREDMTVIISHDIDDIQSGNMMEFSR